MSCPLKLGTFEPVFNYKNRFQFISFSNVFSPDSYKILQEGFDQLKWEKEEASFYCQYSSTIRLSDSTPFALFCDPSFFFPFKSKLERLLETNLKNCISMVAHKLITSQEIDVHNDYCGPDSGYENYRFIFQFARSNQLASGGEISFLASEDKQDIIKKYSYSENTGICFEITPYSYHFVAPVEGERHTLVMYLWNASSKYDGSGIEIQPIE